MGFYLEMNARRPGEYAESEIPKAFWVLYGICGFALICMGGAAYTLLFDLTQTGWIGDQLLVGSILCAVPAYLLFGAKLAWVRKFVQMKGDELEVGFSFFLKKPLWVKSISRIDIERFTLVNQKPSENVAPTEHRDPQYYIRGHWRVGAVLKNGKQIVVDKHTEKEAVQPLYRELEVWLSEGRG